MTIALIDKILLIILFSNYIHYKNRIITHDSRTQRLALGFTVPSNYMQIQSVAVNCSVFIFSLEIQSLDQYPHKGLPSQIQKMYQSMLSCFSYSLCFASERIKGMVLTKGCFVYVKWSDLSDMEKLGILYNLNGTAEVQVPCLFLFLLQFLFLFLLLLSSSISMALISGASYR